MAKLSLVKYSPLKRENETINRIEFQKKKVLHCCLKYCQKWTHLSFNRDTRLVNVKLSFKNRSSKFQF